MANGRGGRHHRLARDALEVRQGVMAIRAARDAVHRFGWRDGALYLLDRALDRFTGGRARLVKYAVVAQPVPEKPLLGASRSELDVRAVSADDPIVRSFPRPPEVIAWRFRGGGLCFVACRGEQFVGFLWLHEQPYEEDEVRCIFVPQPQHAAVWDYDVYVEPEFRLGRAFVRLWDAAYEHLRLRGARWTMSRISSFNSASLASHARLGARKLASATFLCLGCVQLSWFSMLPWVHLSFSHAQRPRLVVRAPGSDLLT